MTKKPCSLVCTGVPAPIETLTSLRREPPRVDTMPETVPVVAGGGVGVGVVVVAAAAGEAEREGEDQDEGPDFWIA